MEEAAGGGGGSVDFYTAANSAGPNRIRGKDN